MQLAGYYLIAAPPQAVWAALADSAVLRVCVPGCKALEKIDQSRFSGSARVEFGPIDAIFDGNVEILEEEPPRRCVLKGEGQGGLAGFVNGEAEILLAPEEEGTALTFAASATVGGALAQMDEHLIEDAGRQIADDFFARLSTEVVTAQTVATPEQPDMELATRPQVLEELSPESPVRDGVGPEIWVVGLIAIIVILLLLFGVVL